MLKYLFCLLCPPYYSNIHSFGCFYFPLPSLCSFFFFFFLVCPFSHHFCSSPLRCSASSSEHLKCQIRLERLKRKENEKKNDAKDKNSKARRHGTFSFTSVQSCHSMSKTNMDSVESAGIFSISLPHPFCISTQKATSLILTCFRPFSCHTSSNQSSSLSTCSFQTHPLAPRGCLHPLCLPQGENLFLSDCLC